MNAFLQNEDDILATLRQQRRLQQRTDNDDNGAPQQPHNATINILLNSQTIMYLGHPSMDIYLYFICK